MAEKKNGTAKTKAEIKQPADKTTDANLFKAAEKQFEKDAQQEDLNARTLHDLEAAAAEEADAGLDEEESSTITPQDSEQSEDSKPAVPKTVKESHGTPRNPAEKYEPAVEKDSPHPPGQFK